MAIDPHPPQSVSGLVSKIIQTKQPLMLLVSWYISSAHRVNGCPIGATRCHLAIDSPIFGGLL